MGLLPAEYRQALRDLTDTSDNPFFWRELRRDLRRAEPYRTLLRAVLWLSSTLLLVGWAVWAILVAIGGTVHAPIGSVGARIAFSVTATVHALLVSHAARNRINGLLAREAAGATLHQLLLTLIGPFELLGYLSVYPFAFGLAVAAAGLPLYIVMVRIGLLTWHELLALYLILAWLAAAAPSWRTPAFQEASPEELSAAVQSQMRTDGVTSVVLPIMGITAACIVGSSALGIHAFNPHWLDSVPPDVWTSLPVLPFTFMWMAVRFLTTPFTWFGVPLPPWIWLIPLLLLGRVSSLWLSSAYLRVAHWTHVPYLPDAVALNQWIGWVGRLRWIAALGYLWQPLLASDLPGGLLRSRTPLTPADNLAGLVYLVGGICLLTAVQRLRARLNPRLPQAPAPPTFRQMVLWFFPAAVVLLVGAITSPRACFSGQVARTTALLGGASATALALAWSLGSGSRRTWASIFALSLFLPLVPFAPVDWLGAANPMVGLLSLSPQLVASQQVLGIPYHIPPWQAALLIPLAFAGTARIAWRRQILPEKVRPPRERRAGAWAPPGAPTAPTQGSPPPQSTAPGWVPPQPQTAEAWTPSPPDLAWRTRRLSVAAAAALRGVYRHTDNPVALLSARRHLPGTMGIDWAILGTGAYLCSFMVAIVVPEMFLVGLVFPVVADLLYPEQLPRFAWGMSMFVAVLVLLTLARSTFVCGAVAKSYRKERERATLGFVLATPLPSRWIAVGHLTGPALPAVVLWGLCGAGAALPTLLLAIYHPVAAVWGWALGFGSALLYLGLSAASGAWFGVTLERARDLSLAGLVPPLWLMALAALGGFLTLRLGVPYLVSAVLFVVLLAASGTAAWALAVNKLERQRRGDLPFEGRTVGA